MSQRPKPQLTRVDLAAGRFLDLLVELGHLDDRMLAVVNDRLLDLQTPDQIVRLDDVKRVTAEVIFDTANNSDPEYARMLEDEWTLLFY